MNYKALALDLDGTLLNETGELEEHVAAALRKAAQAGVNVYLVSGRMHPAILPFWEKIGLDTPIVSYNGCKIQKPGERPLYEKKLAGDFVPGVIEYCRQRDLALNIYFEDKLYILKENEFGRWYAEYFKVPCNIVPGGVWPGESPVKLLVILANGTEMQKIYAEVAELFGRRAHITTSSGRFVEMLPEGVNKATALKVLAEATGVALEEWVAVGDGMNDLEMLLECGAGLAVSNAPQEVLEKVTRVVPPLPRGGIEEVLTRFFGISV